MADGLKDRDLQTYYESMAAMFSTPGWEFMSEDLGRLLKAADTLDGIATQSNLDFRLGQVDILKKMLAQPAVIAAAYEVLLAGEDE